MVSFFQPLLKKGKMPVYISPTGAEVSGEKHDWAAKRAQKLREKIVPNSPMRFFVTLEIDPDLNKDKNVPQCLDEAMIFVNRLFNIADRPIFSSDNNTVFEARYKQFFVRSNGDRLLMLDHIQTALDRDLSDRFRVHRIVDGAVREDWIFQFEQPVLNVSLPLLEEDVVHTAPSTLPFVPQEGWKRDRKASAYEGGPRLSRPDYDLPKATALMSALWPDRNVPILSVTPLYERRVNKLMPSVVRIAFDSRSCCFDGTEHRVKASFMDVSETGGAVERCEVCSKCRPVTLPTSCRAVFDFLDHYWSEAKWMAALNKTYVQVADASITQRMIDENGELVFVSRNSGAINMYLAGHKFPIWIAKKKKAGRPRQDGPPAVAEEFELRFKDVFPHWLHYARRSKCQARVFDPERPPGLAGDFLNMYEGLGVEPKAPASGKLEDAAPLFRAHLREVICDNDPVATEYLEHCLAQLVRYPWCKLGVVFVLKAKQGAGKNTLLDVIRKIFGRHGTEVTNARHVTGNFNQHLATKICVILNEAVWGGDKQSEGTLKASITEATTMFEPKGVDAREGRNYWTFFISSNEKWCVPASPEVRRFFMLPVSDSRIGNAAYFSALHRAIDDGEDREFLWYLQNRACSHPDVWKPAHNMPPRTAAIVDQMMQDRNQSLLRFLLNQLKEDGEWIYPSLREATPIIQKGKGTKVHGERVLHALRKAAEYDTPLRNQLGQQKALALFFQEHLGPCFKNRERLLASEMPVGSTNDKCYWFDSAENIMKHLSDNVLHVPTYFDDQLEPSNANKRPCVREEGH